MELSTEAAQALLAEPNVAVIAIDRPGHAPLAVPIWYDYSPGGDIYIVTPPESFKARVLRASGRCTLVVDTVTPRLTYVSVECELGEEFPASHEHSRRMATRYLPAEAVQGFVDSVPAEGLFTLRPTRWRTADLSP